MSSAGRAHSDIGAISFAAYVGLNGALVAPTSCLISSGQLVGRRICSNTAILLISFAVSIVVLIWLSTIGHGGPLALLAVEESVLRTCARLQTSTLRMKALFLVRSPLWLLHNLLIGAYFAIAGDIVSVLTNEITLAQTLETLGLATPAEASPASRLPTAALLRA